MPGGAPIAVRVIAIDPAVRSTGVAVLDSGEGSIRALHYGVIKLSPKMSQSSCLVSIRDSLADLVREHEPDQCAVEGIIYVQSHRTAITMGAARGAAILACAEHGLPVFEYAAKRVKQAVVGRGGAKKSQVAFMMRALLKLRETPPPDAGDALAIGYAHLQASSGSHPGHALGEQI